TGGWSLDRHFRIAERGRDDRADDRREDAGHRRIAARDRDAEAQRERDQEHQEPGGEVFFPVANEAGGIAARDFGGGGGFVHGVWVPSRFAWRAERSPMIAEVEAVASPLAASRGNSTGPTASTRSAA